MPQLVQVLDTDLPIIKAEPWIITVTGTARHTHLCEPEVLARFGGLGTAPHHTVRTDVVYSSDRTTVRSFTFSIATMGPEDAKAVLGRVQQWLVNETPAAKIAA